MSTSPLRKWVQRRRAVLRRRHEASNARERSRLTTELERATNSTVIVTEYPVSPRVRWGWDGSPPHPELEAAFATERAAVRSLLVAFARSLPALRAIPRTSTDPYEPRWVNEYYSGIDAIALYHFIGARRPASYIEVGSGHSTRFARRAVADAKLGTTLTSIDPAPRAEIDDLCDAVHRVGLQDAPLDLFQDLAAGDIVLIDGSHVTAMGSDVTVAFTELLPRLPAGVLVGIDDVFLPWDYPPSWVDRWYAEQYLLAVLLLAGAPGWRVVLPAWWASNDPLLAPDIAVFDDPARLESGTIGKTFWMERVAG